MRKIVLVAIFIATIWFVFLPQRAAAENVAGRSAVMSYNIDKDNKVVDFFKKKLVIKRILDQYNSPMTEYADSFVDTCVEYDLDCYLLPSIAGLESLFGRHIYPQSYNAFGWGRGLVIFDNWGEGINVVGKGLREDYINKGADSVEKIGAIYCEGNTWAGKVRFFISQFEAEEDKIELFLGQNSVKL